MCVILAPDSPNPWMCGSVSAFVRPPPPSWSQKDSQSGTEKSVIDVRAEVDRSKKKTYDSSVVLVSGREGVALSLCPVRLVFGRKSDV